MSTSLRTMTMFTQCANQHELRTYMGLSMKSSRGGLELVGIGALTRAARAVKLDPVVWRGDLLLPVHKQGLKVLGILIGQPAFVIDFLESKSREQQTLFQRIPWINDPQAAYLLLVFPQEPTFWLRSVRPEFVARHDDNVRSCLLQILGTRTAPSIAHVFSTRALSRGSWSCQCCPCPGCRTLVQLGRFLPHDQTTPPTHR